MMVILEFETKLIIINKRILGITKKKTINKNFSSIIVFKFVFDFF